MKTMKERVLKTLIAYLETNKWVMNDEEIKDVKEQIKAVREHKLKPKPYYNVDDFKGVTPYGKQLMRAFEKKCGKDLMDESIEEGTYVLEKCIKNRFDEVAWCLITYDIYAIDTVKDWNKEFVTKYYFYDNDVCTNNDLIELLECCILI